MSTGYPSIDRPWLKYYKNNAEEEANSIPQNMTVWDVIEERLKMHNDIPAFEYFGRSVSRQEFIKNVYMWARAFKQFGVEENEIVAYYGPFLPDVCYIAFALNIIGACPYFLKLAISTEALAEETKECKIAIVFDQMWANVSCEFTKPRFKKVIVLRATDSMPFPKKQIAYALSGIRNQANIPKAEKYITARNAMAFATQYNGSIKVKFAPDRNAFITSSSGTTIGGIVKGVVATNETVISQLYMEEVSGCQFFPGERCLNHFPPTAATSLNLLFLLPLFRGMTVVIDPRVSERDFYNQITKYKASVICSTGSAWESFFNRLSKEENAKHDFSFSKAWVVGGEGTDIKKFKKWQRIMHDAKSDRGVVSAYGCSEVFASLCTEQINARYDFSKKIMSVGIPFPGFIVGVFDENGKELTYNQRGELRIKSQSEMKGYYNKPDLTAKTKVDGWIHTGDLAEIDEKGFVYVWGRINDVLILSEGKRLYPFDIAQQFKENDYIDDAMVINKPIADNPYNLVAHIVWSETVREEDTQEYLKDLAEISMKLNSDIVVNTFAVHDKMLPYSPTTLKKDRNKMFGQSDGYLQVVDGKIRRVRFIDDESNNACTIVEE